MENFFSNTYSQSRELFLRSVPAEAQVTSFEHPQKGPQGESLFVDVAVLGDKSSDKALVHIVGTHGVEAFAGAAIQQSIFAELKKRSSQKLPKMIFVHPINPFGMAWLRRGNQNNVDLNRNYIDSAERPATAPAFQDLLPIMQQPSKGRILFKILVSLPVLIKAGGKALIQAIAQGQYDHPEAPFFGGREIQPELKFLKDFLTRELKDQKEVWVLDVHTGLGKWGEDTLLVDSVDGRESVQKMREIYQHRVISDDDSQMEYTVHGKLADCVRSTTQAKIYYATQEFGTLSKIKVILTAILENCTFMKGARSVEGSVKKEFKDCFFPPSGKWRRSVLELGQRRYFEVLDYLSR